MIRIKKLRAPQFARHKYLLPASVDKYQKTFAGQQLVNKECESPESALQLMFVLPHMARQPLVQQAGPGTSPVRYPTPRPHSQNYANARKSSHTSQHYQQLQQHHSQYQHYHHSLNYQQSQYQRHTLMPRHKLSSPSGTATQHPHSFLTIRSSSLPSDIGSPSKGDSVSLLAGSIEKSTSFYKTQSSNKKKQQTTNGESSLASVRLLPLQ